MFMLIHGIKKEFFFIHSELLNSHVNLVQHALAVLFVQANTVVLELN